ncbi:2-oxo-tetronate isomerase [Microbacterium sp. MAHUQ-60]|uniref:2-oxo-tetronate isomerase n=1 Tax=unclassified Microbacterium TaxID=2609290 RepID=UPI0036092E4C
MMRFAANLTMLYTRLPFIERFAAARMDGFTAVEFVSPYEHSPDELAQVLRENDLTPVLFNLPAGDWAAGERGIAALPDRKHEFREGVEGAIRFAKALGVTQLNCLAGAPSTAVSPREVHDTLVENLAFAAAELARHDIRLLLEPVNDRDVPGFAVATVEDAVDIIAEVGSPNLFLQYDLYHAQVMQGDLLPTFLRHQEMIRHIQIADHPGRHEPGTGEINYRFLLPAIRSAGYEGWFGCEYIPGDPGGMGWLSDFDTEEES